MKEPFMSKNLPRLMEIMELLRDPEKGCPWDVEQTFETIVPHTIEEAYEVAEAIETGDMAAFEDELGDFLLQVVFHAQMAKEQGLFDFDSVAGAICNKLIRRHPHVFGDVEIKSADEQLKAWESHKALERRKKAGGEGKKEDASALAGVSVSLPAMTRALKLQKRAARVGFDWNEANDVLEKLNEETVELVHEMKAGTEPERIEDELGDLLFTCVNLARKLDIDPDTALRKANRKFDKRFRLMEGSMKADGKPLAPENRDDMEGYWDKAKEKA